jgi:hypothetical protein
MPSRPYTASRQRNCLEVWRSDGLDPRSVLGLASGGRSISEQPGARHWPSTVEGLGATEADVLVEVTASPSTDGEPGSRTCKRRSGGGYRWLPPTNGRSRCAGRSSPSWRAAAVSRFASNPPSCRERRCSARWSKGSQARCPSGRGACSMPRPTSSLPGRRKVGVRGRARGSAAPGPCRA